MKPIFKELVFRGLYIFILSLTHFIYAYLSYGMQLEYFSAWFAYAYQSPDFTHTWSRAKHLSTLALGFELESLFNPAPACFAARDPALALGKKAFQRQILPHGSLSWNGLSFPNLLYFYNLELESGLYNMFVIFYLFSTLLPYFALQGGAFASPGTFEVGRKNLTLGVGLSFIFPYFCLQLAFALASLDAELRFETYDSELFCNTFKINSQG